MEGMNIGAFLLGFLATCVLGGAALVAVGFLIADRIRIATIVFASGLLAAAVIVALAVLSFFLGLHGDGDYNEYQGYLGMPMTLQLALIVLLAGVGQFAAVFRSFRTYAESLGCALASLLLLLGSCLGRGLDLMGRPASLIVAFGLFAAGCWQIAASRRTAQKYVLAAACGVGAMAILLSCFHYDIYFLLPPSFFEGEHPANVLIPVVESLLLAVASVIIAVLPAPREIIGKPK